MTSVAVPVSTATTAYALLEDVIRAIEEEPRRLYMPTWFLIGHDLETSAHMGMHAGIPACGTAGCIAGWIDLLSRDEAPVEHVVTAQTPQSNAADFAIRTLFGTTPTLSRESSDRWADLSLSDKLGWTTFDDDAGRWVALTEDARLALPADVQARMRYVEVTRPLNRGTNGIFYTYPNDYAVHDGAYVSINDLEDKDILYTRIQNGSPEAAAFMIARLRAYMDTFADDLRAQPLHRQSF